MFDAEPDTAFGVALDDGVSRLLATRCARCTFPCVSPASRVPAWQGYADLLGRRDRVHVGQMRKMRRLQRACQNTEPRMDLPNLAGSEG